MFYAPILPKSFGRFAYLYTGNLPESIVLYGITPYFFVAVF
jgi:hypothetical protein